MILTAGLQALLATQVQAQSRCERVREVKACVSTTSELDRYQRQISSSDSSIKLRQSLNSVFQSINGRNLVLYYLGRHDLKIQFKGDDVTVVFNGEVSNDVKICFEACPGEGKVAWYSDTHGEFKKIRNGLSVGGYEFKVVD